MKSSFQRLYSSGTLLLVGTFLLGLVLRLGWIDAHGLWNDEVISINTASNGLPYIFANRFGWLGNQTTWYYALLWLMSQPLDPAASAALVRLPSALAGAFLPLIVYGLGRELFSRTAGLMAAFMTALSPVMLDYSHDVRPYSLFAFLTTASIYCLIMAERTGKVGWWAGFVATTVANLLNAYIALTLAMPALALYLAWVLWRTWRRRKEEGQARQLLFLLVSLGIVALVGIAMLLEVMQMPRAPVNWSNVSVTSLVTLPLEVATWFASIGINNALAPFFTLILLFAAIVSVYVGVHQKQVRGIAICVLFCLVPFFILTILVTSNSFFPRYTIFVGPFFFLLVGNTVASALLLNPFPGKNGPALRSLRVGGMLLAALIAVRFIVGASSYINPDNHHDVSYRPDFRGAADYLSKNSNPQDLIIVADDPSLGYNVTDFYWHDQPPAHLYDVRDPLLFRQPVQGDIYWVVSSLDPQLEDALSANHQGWLKVVKLENVVVLEESASGQKIDTIVEQMVDKLDALHPGYQPILTMRGGILQARGDAAGAAKMFREAGTYFPLGDEYLRTAEGFTALGLDAKAWREGIIAKAMEPYQPNIHLWLAQQLQQAGYSDEALAERNVAAALQSDAAAASR